MSLVSKLNGKTQKDKEFIEILKSVAPQKQDYYTLSGRIPFSDEYTLEVPNLLSNKMQDSSLVGTAFDYLARFRIAQFLEREDVIYNMVAVRGFRKIPNYKQHIKIVGAWIDRIIEIVKGSSIPISSLYEIATHLAKLEQIARARMKKEDINLDYLLFESSPSDVIDDLHALMGLFEERFMIPEIITKDEGCTKNSNKRSKKKDKNKKEVEFNPNFGVGTYLVSGADADIFIDGTLYDFKTTQDKALKGNDNLQIIGYYLLNEIAIATLSDLLDFGYVNMNIKRLAFYKARYGEVEYYDVAKFLPYKDARGKVKELAEYFRDNQGSLHTAFHADIDSARKYLEELRAEEIV